MPKPTVKTVTRVIGIKALAAELGVGRQHLYKVINGKRRSDRLAAKLAEFGIRCKRPRAAR